MSEVALPNDICYIRYFTFNGSAKARCRGRDRGNGVVDEVVENHGPNVLNRRAFPALVFQEAPIFKLSL